MFEKWGLKGLKGREQCKTATFFSRLHNQEQSLRIEAAAQAASGQRAGALHLVPREHDGVISPGKQAAHRSNNNALATILLIFPIKN